MKIRGNINSIASEMLTEPVEVFEPVLVSDGEGGYSVTLNKTADIWGMFVPEGNSRTLISSEVTFTHKARLIVRFPLTITDSYKLGIDGNTWTIHSMKNLDNRREYLDLIIYR